MMDSAWAARLQAVGYARDEVIGRSVPDIAVWVDPRQRDAGLAELRAGRSIRNVEARFRAKNGREIVAITNADVIVIDGRPCILTALIDITDRVRAETALRESERRFAQLFQANPLPMTIVSMRTHRHLDVNDAAVRHSGYSREEMLGRTKPELGFWVAAEQRDDLLHQLLSSGQARDFEVTFRTKTGEEPASAVRAESAPPAAPAPGSARNRRRRVLVVEDNADAREGLRLVLTYAGHEVETSEDASSGLDKLKSFRPEVALIDIGLPGVDGYALARMARQTPEAKATYLVALTGYGQAEDRQKALAAGFDMHMTKPVDPAKLCAFLTES